MLFRSGNERFANLPMPVEDSSKAVEGEFLVGRTTGHMYVRSGGKNLSKTVEIEEFLEQFRVGCINMVRNSGDFSDYAIDREVDGRTIQGDWMVGVSTGGTKAISIVENVGETDHKMLKIKTGNMANTTGSKYAYVFNRMYKYTNFTNRIFKNGKKYTVSFLLYSNVTFDMNVCIQNTGSREKITDAVSTRIKTGWNKYEVTLTGNGHTVSPDIGSGDKPGLWMGLPVNVDVEIHLGDVQIESGDRSSDWRMSWLDLIQRMDGLHDGLKDYLLNKINLAITECKNYTDSEIGDLITKIKIWIQECYDKSKEYTDSEITEVNNTIKQEMDKVNAKIEDFTTHLNFGQFDWRKYANGEGIAFDNTVKSVYLTSRATMLSKNFIPISETSKYYIEMDFELISADNATTVLHAGVATYSENKEEIKSDASNSYNYCIASSLALSVGQRYKKGVIMQGYNTPTGSATIKFDPRGSYFKPVILPFWSGNPNASTSGKLFVHSIKIFEIPECLWDALSEVTLNKNGLMTPALLDKLNNIEDRANRYVHPTSDGNKHVPATGTTNNGKVLMAGSTAGSLSWANLPTDMDTVDGKHSNEFVWNKEVYNNGSNQNTATVFREVETVTNNSSVQTGKIPAFITDVKVVANATYNMTIDVNSANITGTVKICISTDANSNIGILKVYCANTNIADHRVVNKRVSVNIEGTSVKRFVIYFASSAFEEARIALSLRECIIVERDLRSHTLHNEARLTYVDRPSTLPGIIAVNNYVDNLGAEKLAGRASTDFANMIFTTSGYTQALPTGADRNKYTIAKLIEKDGWIVLNETGSTNTGIFYRHTGTISSAMGDGKAVVFVKENVAKHALNLDNGDATHLGKVKASNLDTGRFNIKYNSSNECLEFIFE